MPTAKHGMMRAINETIVDALTVYIANLFYEAFKATPFGIYFLFFEISLIISSLEILWKMRYWPPITC
ncbi:hypothetical protein JdFRA1000001_05c [uncultured archaeal virus]|uniref:Uncharacterized protein n=1 Tax=uncultured archaeal virus TaxID=1960247 RepID=A0A1S5Y2V4_9VIRU|nr:hypothetical protein JdFRA1000001_05c [uncultured archaeal virus]